MQSSKIANYRTHEGESPQGVKRMDEAKIMEQDEIVKAMKEDEIVKAIHDMTHISGIKRSDNGEPTTYTLNELQWVSTECSAPAEVADENILANSTMKPLPGFIKVYTGR